MATNGLQKSIEALRISTSGSGMPKNRTVEEVKLMLRAILPLGIVMLVLMLVLVVLVLLVAFIGKLWLNIDFDTSVTDFLGKGFLITVVIAALGWLLKDDRVRERLIGPSSQTSTRFGATGNWENQPEVETGERGPSPENESDQNDRSESGGNTAMPRTRESPVKNWPQQYTDDREYASSSTERLVGLTEAEVDIILSEMGFSKTWEEGAEEASRPLAPRVASRKLITYEYPERKARLRADVLTETVMALWGDEGVEDRARWRLLRSKSEIVTYFRI